jgi:DNA-binding response OmpR family regulator
MHILFVDDHVESADAFAALATSLGHRTQVAYDGLSARCLAVATQFDAVCFDINLPDADGRELVKLIRAQGASKHACIIAVTGMTDLPDEDLALFDGYLHKPITVEALTAVLRSAEG